MAAALAIKDEEHRAHALAVLAPRLTGKAQTQALEQGLEAVLAIEHKWAQAEALVALAPQARDELLRRGLKAALALEDNWARAWALGRLAPQLKGQTQTQALAEALTAAQAREATPWTEWRPSQVRTPAVAPVMRASLWIGWRSSRARALAALAPHLTGEAWERGLTEVLTIENRKHRAKALLPFLPTAPDAAAVLHSARQALAEHLLKDLSHARREEVLQFCTEERLFSPPLIDQDTLGAIAEHIVEVCQEWRWM